MTFNNIFYTFAEILKTMENAKIEKVIKKIAAFKIETGETKLTVDLLFG